MKIRRQYTEQAREASPIVSVSEDTDDPSTSVTPGPRDVPSKASSQELEGAFLTKTDGEVPILEFDNFWQQAECELRRDPAKAKLYDGYLEILYSSNDPTRVSTVDRDTHVTKTLELKINEMKGKQQQPSVASERSTRIRERIITVSTKILDAKDLMDCAVSASAPAVLVLAGTMVLLTVGEIFLSAVRITGTDVERSIEFI